MAGEEKPNSKEYTTVQLPKALSDIIDRYMTEHPEFGYRSRAEFIMDVLRRRLEELGLLPSN